MVSSNFIVSLTALAATAFASATPIATRQSVSAPFFLRTKVVSGDASKNDLFAVAWHSYAGGNDVALFANSTETPSSLAFLNGTNVQFDLTQGSEFPWGLYLNNLDGDSYWDNWNAAGINGGVGDANFLFDGNKLVNNGEFDVGGWLACDWARQVPQLFWFSSFVDVSPGNIPSSCAVVDLIKVAPA